MLDELNETYSVEKMAENEWKTFALYTVNSRAIPSMIDGLKPSQRFYLAASIDMTKTGFDKVAAVSGALAKYGYNHGEGSAGQAGVGMAQNWKNNLCLIQGRGSFGTRLVPHAAAPRYIYSKLSPDFSKVVKDIDLAPAHADPEHVPPAFYVPVIPLVLANGAEGVATGFATKIFPRKVSDLVKACQEYIKTGKIKNKLIPYWNEFNGTIVEESAGKYTMTGCFERKGKTGVVITEVPIGHDRESYVSILDDLEDKGLIVGYEDQCGKHGFQFEVTLKRGVEYTDKNIVSMFKLSVPMSENLTVVDWRGKLKVYDNPHDIVVDFCEYRKSIYSKRIQKNINESTELVRWTQVKAEFITRVLDEVITFKGKTKADIGQKILEIKHAVESDVDRLLRLNIMTLTQEMVEELKVEQQEAIKKASFWRSETWENQFAGDLDELK